MNRHINTHSASPRTGLVAFPLPAAERSPGYGQLRKTPADWVPVLCGPVGQGEGLNTMMDILDAGHAVALWRATPHPPHGCGSDCDAFRREVDTLLAQVSGVAELPEAVRRLRARSADHPDHWSNLGLLYDDPNSPLESAP